MKAHIHNASVQIDDCGYNECITSINKQWQTLSSKLIKDKIDVNNLEYLFSQPEFKWFFKMFNESGCELQSIKLSDVKSLYRFICEKDASKINESRFIPQFKYAGLNRMNDKNKLYEYLVTDYNSPSISDIIKTGVREIRANNGKNVYYSLFRLNPQYNDSKIINLRFPYSDTKELYRNLSEANPNDKDYFRFLLMQLIMELFEKSDMFSPVDKTKKDDILYKQYRPFHFISNYFETMGYSGILYASTVYPKGTNLVLFNTDYCSCQINTISKIL